jgi:hypothetical protein
LAFIFVALTVTLEAMPKDFVEKDGSGASAKKRGSIVGFRYGRLAQGFQVFGHLVDLRDEFRLAGQAAGRGCLKRFHPEQLHAILGARLRFHYQASGGTGRGDGRALARHETGI